MDASGHRSSSRSTVELTGDSALAASVSVTAVATESDRGQRASQIQLEEPQRSTSATVSIDD